MASTNLSRTLPSGSATTKFTYSVWLKYTGWVSGGQRFFSAVGTGDTYFRFNEDGTMEVSGHNSGASSAGYFITNRRFNDRSSWYHIVIRFDSTESSASNRLRLYVNGVQQESFSTYTDVNSGATDNINLSGNTQYVGGAASSQYFNGLMSHINYCDGYSYAPTEFGETDSTTGQWKLKPTVSVTYGDNGFFILKNSNSVTDQSGKGNNFAVANGTFTDAKDCPDNVFATWNASIGNMDILTNGNTTVARSASSWRSAFSSLPLPTTGKFYWEVKLSTGTKARIGIADDSFDGSIDTQNRGLESELGEQTNGISYADNGNSNTNTTQIVGYGSAITTSNVLGVAVDMTNMKLYYSVDGVFQNSGDPTSGATGTGALSIPATTGKYFSAVSMNASGYHVNFGNGTFGTTDITDAGTPGSTPGEFEYDVPTGYQPLTTKGLNA